MRIEKVESHEIPQVDSLPRIMEALWAIAKSGELSEDTFDLSHRHINYMKQALRVLGLIDKSGNLTARGREVATSRTWLADLRKQFSNSLCGLAWMRAAGVVRIERLDALSAVGFLKRHTDMPSGMVERRGRTLRRWCRQFQAPVETTVEVRGPRHRYQER
jgi:hypothetical protein